MLEYSWERLKAKGKESGRGQDDQITSLIHCNEFEQTLGDSEGQGSLAYCGPWGHRESDMTQQLNKQKKSQLAML